MQFDQVEVSDGSIVVTEELVPAGAGLMSDVFMSEVAEESDEEADADDGDRNDDHPRTPPATHTTLNSVDAHRQPATQSADQSECVLSAREPIYHPRLFSSTLYNHHLHSAEVDLMRVRTWHQGGSTRRCSFPSPPPDHDD